MTKKKSLAPIGASVVVRFEMFPDYHEPLCKTTEAFCQGCSWRRSRINRNRRAGRSIGIGMTSTGGDEPERTCAECKAPAYRGMVGEQNVTVLGWNYCTNRAQWAVEEPGGLQHTLCPRCRARGKAA